MAKQSSILKNSKRKSLISQYKEKRKNLLLIAKNKNESFEARLSAQIKLAELPRNGSYIRYRNRCSLTGRPRGFMRKFSLSRIALRDFAAWGDIPGLRKSSW
ncbi:30S ribosomal protein S14 [Flavobacteriaceae bacterium]|nr:30S ribosomal protein S14 [Flavobacteriaceae bacterium]